MAAHRGDRINVEVKRELASIVRELRDPRIPELISITAVEVTPDLKFCKAYVSLFGSENTKEIMKALNKSAGFVRRELGHRIKLRHIPEITFAFDNSIEHGSKMLKIIGELDIPEPPLENEEEE